MIEVALSWPWMLGAPFLVTLGAWLTAKRGQSALFPKIGLLRKLPQSLRQALYRPIRWALSLALLITAAIAAAGPFRSDTIVEPELGINLMLTLDVSRSMEAPDFESRRGLLSRVNAMKMVVADFVRQRARDRIGLVVFGESAFLQAPLTMDHDLLQELIKTIHPGMAGDATAIGDGLGVSIKRLRNIEGDSRAIVLLTDGVNNAGQVGPLKAAKVASEVGIKIHTIGIGASRESGRSRSFSGAGAGLRPDFDEATLKEVARITGGLYFNAQSLEKLQQVYDEIDKLERSASEVPTRQVADQRFAPYVLAAILFYLLYLLAAEWLLMKVP